MNVDVTYDAATGIYSQLQTATRYQPIPTLAPYAPTAETLHEFQARALRHMIATGALYSLDRETLEQADQAACRMAVSLPKDLDAVQGTLNQRIANIRHSIARELDRRRRVLADLQRKLDATDASTPGVDPSDPIDDLPETNHDRGVRLLRAALILIMGDDDRGGGGRKAPLVPPAPTQPPQGTAVARPAAPPAGYQQSRPAAPAARKPADGIAF
jgi:hypothetical protein